MGWTFSLNCPSFPSNLSIIVFGDAIVEDVQFTGEVLDCSKSAPSSLSSSEPKPSNAVQDLSASQVCGTNKLSLITQTPEQHRKVPSFTPHEAGIRRRGRIIFLPMLNAKSCANPK